MVVINISVLSALYVVVMYSLCRLLNQIASHTVAPDSQNKRGKAMEYVNSKWLQHPELYYPEPMTIINVIKWHIAISDKAGKAFYEINKEAYGKDIPCMSEIKRSPEAEALYKRDKEYIESLGYQNIVLIQVAMMVGRELWYKQHTGHTDYENELAHIGIDNLSAWLDVFDIPRTLQEGGNLSTALDYTLGKITEFLQTYIDAYGRSQEGGIKNVQL